MRKILLFLMTLCFVVLMTSKPVFVAEDFSGREEEMNKKCAVIEGEATQQECIAYKQYLDEKWNHLDQEIEKIQEKIDLVQSDMRKLEEDIAENNKQLEKLTKNIKSVSDSIEKSEKRIKELEASIDAKTLDITQRDENMKQRLRELQPYTASNQYIDFIMGSKSFADLLRRTEIISELSSYESLQMELLAQERAVLDEDKTNYEAQKEMLETQKHNLESEKAKEEKLLKLNEKLIGEYRVQEDQLYEEKVTLQLQQADIPYVDTTLITQSNPSIPDTVVNLNDIAPSDSFIKPLKGDEYVYSAGTWAYPAGGIHRGVDFGTFRQGLDVVAPANGVVVWTYEGCPSPEGNNYPNTCGIPMGGGNNLLFVCQIDDIVYAMPMYHLQSLSVNTGQMVSQGETLGLSGNSGNSTGPHLHIEIIKVGKMSLRKAVDLYNRNKDFTFGTGWGTDPKPCGDAPCRLRPEYYWVKN
jgi:murein DD-endopeptidase MepM/ murein hydrolase activator NlpD